MAESVIKMENVSKVFRIYDRPGDRLKEAFSFNRRKLHTDFPALKNVSFDVKKGEFLGIVGKNGAGKSTLLKLLSRELTPTSGTIEIRGKVSLLQLGVGFDPELTGIENARFATKLLEYSDDEVDEMLEEIIAFADLGEFIRHPVKTYSSGMYSRLSFAVGINIDPDILIADEVLSVGDMRFSQKCLRKMREFKDLGKTVIFVSHDIQSVNIFCDTAIWMKDGEVFMHGKSKQVTTGFQNYMLFDRLPDPTQRNLQSSSDKTELSSGENELFSEPEYNDEHTQGLRYSDIDWLEGLDQFSSVSDGSAKIERFAFIKKTTRESVKTIQGNEDVILFLDVRIFAPVQTPQIGWLLYDKHGSLALHTNNDICGTPLSSLQAGQRIRAGFHFALPGLANGNYIFSIGLQNGQSIAHKIDDIYEFSISRSDPKGMQCGYVIIEKETFDYVLSGN